MQLLAALCFLLTCLRRLPAGWLSGKQFILSIFQLSSLLKDWRGSRGIHFLWIAMKIECEHLNCLGCCMVGTYVGCVMNVKSPNCLTLTYKTQRQKLHSRPFWQTHIFQWTSNLYIHKRLILSYWRCRKVCMIFLTVINWLSRNFVCCIR